MTEVTPPPPLPSTPDPSEPPHLSPSNPHPTRADLFSLTASASQTPPLSTSDPRVSLRAPLPTSPYDVEADPAADSENPHEPHTLSEFREAEDPAKRQSRLRRLFETIPLKLPSPPSSPAASTSALPEMEKEEEKQCEANRKIYARELWRKCNGHPSPSSSTTASASVDSRSSGGLSAGSLREEDSRPTTPTPLSPAVRWSAFERYAEEKEKELWRVFVELDVDGDMRLRKAEVREACRRAGVEVKETMLDDFIRAVDQNNDGAISFDEWRDFLLLLPRPTSMSEILKYYQTHRLHRPSMSRLNQDGDVAVGGGKTGWNKLLGKPAVAAKEKARHVAELKEGTNLKNAEGKNDERKWAEETEQIKVAKEEQAKHDIDMTRQGSGMIDVKGKGKAVKEEIEQPKPAPPVVFEELDDEDDEDEEDEHGATHGMFSGAGKFLLAGGLAGAVSRTATAPFDRLKVYLITSPSTQPPPDAKPCPKTGKENKFKKGRQNKGSIPAAVRAVLKQGGGVKAFWTGNGLNVVKIFPESAIKFLSYESAKRVFAQYWDHVPDQTMISNSSRFVAGGIGGVVSQFVIYPIETLKTRVMSSTGGDLKGNTLIAKTARDMWMKGGIRLYFRGLPAGLIGVFPYSAIDMSTFEGIKLAYTKWAGEEPGIPGSLAFGALSGGIGATSVYPLNLVRTRLQAQGTRAHPQTYSGVRDAAMKCYLREGWRGFYKGLTPTLVKVVPAVAISYAVYDASKKVLFGREESNALTAHHDDDCDES